MRPRPLLLALGIGIIGLALLGAWPPVRAGLLDLGRLLAAGDLSSVREHLRGSAHGRPSWPSL